MKYLKYFEDSGMGMGAVVNAQPSSIPGATIGSAWSDFGGTIGSGDVSSPINTYISVPPTSISNKLLSDVTKGKKKSKLPKANLKKKKAKKKANNAKVMDYDQFIRDEYKLNVR